MNVNMIGLVNKIMNVGYDAKTDVIKIGNDSEFIPSISQLVKFPFYQSDNLVKKFRELDKKEKLPIIRELSKLFKKYNDLEHKLPQNVYHDKRPIADQRIANIAQNLYSLMRTYGVPREYFD